MRVQRSLLLSVFALLLAVRAVAAPDATDLRWLDRITYGANAASLARLDAVGREAFLAEQLDASGEGLPEPQVARLAALDRLQRPLAESQQAYQRAFQAVQAVKADAEARRDARRALDGERDVIVAQVRERLLLRAVYDRHQLREQMTWFWFNHFNVFAGKEQVGFLLADYDDRLRTHALGNFRDLVMSSLTHPAMLQYLDNRRSKKGRINENYARELLELHTLGVDGGYTQKDVQEVARVLTGLAPVPPDDGKPRPALRHEAYRRFGEAEFNPLQHDGGDKRVLGHSIAGAGWPEVEQLVELLMRHPATSRHVARRLATYFVEDDPSPALVERLAQRFRESDGEIRPMLQLLFASPEFTASLGKKYKSSWQYVVSALRVATPTLADEDARAVTQALQPLAQVPYARSTPDGYSLLGKSWRSAGQLEARLEFARQVSLQAARESVPVAVAVEARLPLLSEAHRARVAAERKPSRRLMLLLASPEFMYR